MPLVHLSEQSVRFLTKRIRRKTRELQSLPDNERRKRANEVKHWEHLDRKFSGREGSNTPDGINMTLKRVELKSLQVMVLEQITKVQTVLIPAYEDRIDKIPHKAEFYQGYLNKLADLLVGMNEVSIAFQKAMIP